VTRNWSLLTGAALGAGTMFLLDPDRGARRRALVRDKFVRATHKTTDGLDALSRDVSNRARGAAAQVQQRLQSDEDVDSRKLIERVRAELGRTVSHPRAIDVSATDDGCIRLSGPILTDVAAAALAAIGAVRGVCYVEDQLERHATSEGVPSLQGGRTRPGRRSALLQDSWSPTTKLLACVTGGALAAGLGFARRARTQTSH
jgi:gas vesicle protein